MANEKNLVPFPKGKSGNPKGRPKGIKNWSTVVQTLLADENLLESVLPSKPSYWDAMPVKNGASLIVVAMMIRAMEGNKDAAEWLRKAGFGDKLTVDAEDGLFQVTKLELEIVKSDETEIETKRDPEA